MVDQGWGEEVMTGCSELFFKYIFSTFHEFNQNGWMGPRDYYCSLPYTNPQLYNDCIRCYNKGGSIAS